jgi:hypothetical protein
MAVNRIRTTPAVPPKAKSSANWKSVAARIFLKTMLYFLII